ncbi:MAG: hypothetical protein HZB99_01565 [Candidatus Harrisonbacteria bacterium]|nr:hypothetical protein [Candidatus Harrisonbacteria bacterium]
MQTRILTVATFGIFTLVGCSSLGPRKTELNAGTAIQKSGTKDNLAIKKNRITNKEKIEIKCAISHH